MRRLGFLIAFLLSATILRQSAVRVPQPRMAGLHIPAMGVKPTDPATDTNTLKKSNWYAAAINLIRESEYEIRYDPGRQAWAGPNRSNNLKSIYTPQVFTLLPRNDSSDTWKLALSTTGLFAGNKNVSRPEKNSTAILEKNKLQFRHEGNFITEFINSPEGIRQNFIITAQPDGHTDRLAVKLQANKGWHVNKVHDREIHFAKATASGLEKKITYNSLKAWDAANRELEASFSVNGQTISINVNAAGAVYPLTIDPLSTGTLGTADWAVNNSAQLNAYFGYSVSGAGDVNGDGYGDVIIGAYLFDDGANTDEGRAFVYHGSATGLSTTPNSIPDDANQAGALFGRSVANVGDINGDGYGDVIIGAPNYTDGANSQEGSAFTYYGSAAGLSTTPADILDDADQALANFGYSVSGAGDVNGDGFSDVIVGASSFTDGANTQEGRAFVYHGSSFGLSVTPDSTPDDADQANAIFGSAVACAGDVNGDGYSDVIIGAYSYDDGANTNEGRAFVYYGSASGISSSPDNTPDDADQAAAFFGYDVAGAGDVNGDGYGDIIVGAFQYTDGGNANEGRAFVYYGSSTGLSAAPDATPDDANIAGAKFGYSVAVAGDVNGDGYSDVIIGAHEYNDGANAREGRAFVYYGSSTGLSPTPNATPDDANQAAALFGSSVSSAGDVNGDGYSDVIIGGPEYDVAGGTNEGRAYVYHGAPNGINTVPVLLAESNQAGASLGVSVSAAGDVNADGYGDILIGASGYSSGESLEGVVFVFHGSATGPASTPTVILESNLFNCSFGTSVSAAGDVNGDGYGDIVVGADGYSNGEPGEGAVYVFTGSATGLNNTPVALLESNQAFASMGVSVSGAGDINGDGYSDIIAGAFNYDDIELNEGAAFIYYGRSTGINPAYVLLECNQASSAFGIKVAGAGDVNGDGFSDVIAGAIYYDDGQTDEGGIFIFMGSFAGINTTAAGVIEPNVSNYYLGSSLSAAGDVNGDGFGDVIIGVPNYFGGQSNEGAAIIYHGAAAGLNLIGAIALETNQAGAGGGFSVASAGDVNGDGYSDVIAGAYLYSNGESNEGVAFVYKGSPTGVNSTPIALLESNQATSIFGISVAGAGDVNGDGYSDVMAGAYWYDNGQTDEGAAFVFNGNGNSGYRNNLFLYNSDLVTPIQQSNMADPNLFGAGLYAKSFEGRQKGKMVWETVKNGTAFSGNPITNSTSFTAQSLGYSDLGLTGTEIKNQIAKQVATKATYIRGRIKYNPANSITGQVYGPWRYPDGFLRGRRDVGSVALPLQFLSFTAEKENNNAKLTWITSQEEPNTLYEVQHSVDGIHFTGIGSRAGLHLDRNEYTWMHYGLTKGIHYYRIKAVENGNKHYSAVRTVSFTTEGIVKIYPNPAAAGSCILVQLDEPVINDKITISLVAYNGQVIPLKIQSVNNRIIQCQLPETAGGVYTIRIQSGSVTLNNRLLIQK